MLFSSPAPPTPSEAMNVYRSAFNTEVAAKRLQPVVLPYVLYGYLLVGSYLSISHKNRPWLYQARWLVFAIACWWNIKMVFQASSVSMGTAFGLGLICTWGCLWSGKWLLLERMQWDWKRVEVRRAVKESGKPMEGGGKGEVVTEYYWQSYPEDDLWDRWNWMGDVLLGCRYPGWNRAIPQLPSLPPEVLAKLGEPITDESKKDRSYVGLRRFRTRESLARTTITKLVLEYLLLDFILTQQRRDPYFTLGPNSYPLPPHLSRLSPQVVTMYRQLLTCASLIMSLDLIFALAPLFFSIIPSTLTSIFPPILRMQPYYYADSWGSPVQILDKGLAGVWGGYWHQTFRHVFAAPTEYLVGNGYVGAKSTMAKLASLFFAFGFSGVIHAGGSVGQFPNTKPLHAIVFFALQAVGILVQSVLCQTFKAQIGQLPRWLRRAGNLAYCLGWGHLTADWLLDDFARGGLWLYEPFPYSVFRGLGFGNDDEGWSCWGDRTTARWYSGEHWWQSGLAI